MAKKRSFYKISGKEKLFTAILLIIIVFEMNRTLLASIPKGDDEGKYSGSFRLGLINARLDLKLGKLISHKQLKKQLK